MASHRVVPAFLLLILSLHLLEPVHAASQAAATLPKPTGINCGGACAVRCSRSWRQKMCVKMCNVCCGRCSCVPPGTGVETRALCPCYANMRNPKGMYKCP